MSACSKNQSAPGTKLSTARQKCQRRRERSKRTNFGLCKSLTVVYDVCYTCRMKIYALTTQEIPTYWDDAAFNEVKAICELLNEDDALLSQMRSHFDLMVDRWFSDIKSLTAPNNTDALVADWQELARLTLQWGSRCFYLVTLNTLTNTLVKKQRDYGHENIARFGRQGLLIRTHDKLARLENLTKVERSYKAQNESITDTVLDIAGYSTIGVMWERGTFLLPLK
jgi:hypothetical protein